MPEHGKPEPGIPLPRIPQPGTSEPGPQQPSTPQGLSWSWELDFQTLMTALNEPAPWNRPPRSSRRPPAPGRNSPQGCTPPASADSDTLHNDTPGNTASRNTAAAAAPPSATAPDRPAAQDTTAVSAAVGIPGSAAAGGGDPEAGQDTAEVDQDAVLDALLAAESRELPIGMVAGRIAECLPPGPDLAGWLATATASELEDGALAGVAASCRRLASWAQAAELAAVAQIASRSAARDEKIGVDAHGRPARVPAEAAAQVSLALAMSQYGASWWLDLAVTLAWRLAATGAALAAGSIDLQRARLIAEATTRLSDDAARTVEEQVLPGAGDLTTSALRIALRRAVIAADPDGAERRRKESEAQAKVCLFPDEDNTATLGGYRLPAVLAAAAMARIRAMARALKSSGAGGGIDRLSAQVFLGLLCGTLPLIPPPDGAPPDNPPPDGGDDSFGPPSDDGSSAQPRPPRHVPSPEAPRSGHVPADAPQSGQAPTGESSPDHARPLGQAWPAGEEQPAKHPPPGWPPPPGEPPPGEPPPGRTAAGDRRRENRRPWKPHQWTPCR